MATVNTPTLADYHVLRDIEGMVTIGDPLIIPFVLQPSFAKGNNIAKPIIGFMADPQGDLSFTLRINNGVQRHYNLNPGSHRVIWEVVHGDIFNTANENILSFEVTSGPPSMLRVSDIVLWFQHTFDH
jgi:hypothetical protein